VNPKSAASRSAASSGAMPIAVLFSGRGSNLAYLLQCIDSGQLPVRIDTVICNRAGAAGLRHLFSHALDVHLIDDRLIADWHSDIHGKVDRQAARTAFEQYLASAIAASAAQLIVLAGFMRILSPQFISLYAGRIINLHPSLLPAYPGLDTHARALAAGEQQYGASIHLVDASLDGGAILARHRMDIAADADANSMAAALLPHEHRLLAACIALFCQHTVTCVNQHIAIDDQPLRQPLMLDQDLHWP
jgi:phosphoribosylglycinamide formyltransferase-1